MLSQFFLKGVLLLVKTNSVYEFLMPVRPTHFFLIWGADFPTISSGQRNNLVVDCGGEAVTVIPKKPNYLPY